MYVREPRPHSSDAADPSAEMSAVGISGALRAGPPGLRQRIPDDERGAGYLAAFIVLFSVLAGTGVGILVDSARILATDRQCSSIALEAARAGANAIDIDAVRAGQTSVDPAQASAAASSAASAFVSGSGASLVSVQVAGDQVTVRVSATVDPWFPAMHTRTLTQEATVRATRGD